jgi:cytochrome b6-f complex subunit 4
MWFKVVMTLAVLVKPFIGNPILRAKLSKGMGHNSYGEIAWPNDLLYTFPICILGVLGLSTSLGVLCSD